jgi:hypothetical protein
MINPMMIRSGVIAARHAGLFAVVVLYLHSGAHPPILKGSQCRNEHENTYRTKTRYVKSVILDCDTVTGNGLGPAVVRSFAQTLVDGGNVWAVDHAVTDREDQCQAGGGMSLAGYRLPEGV